MVGSDRGKEAMAMMALHEALRNVCINSDWTYSVFWTIRPRPRSRGGTGCKVGDENGSLMLMWEDGYCRPSKPTNPRLNRLPPGPFNNSAMAKSPSFDCLEEMDADDPVRKAFRKMSIQLYNYGEGLMGKVASDKCHKWVFKEPNECEAGISNYWQSSFDAHPPEWTDQFASGIQTIVVIQAGHGLLQLGSCKIIPEDLHFVLRMRHAFDSLGYQSGFYLSQLFSAQATAGNNSNRANNGGACNTTSPPPALPQPKPAMSPRPPIYNWNPRPPLQGGGPLGMGLGSPHVHQLRPQHQQHQQETSTSHLLLPVSQQAATAAGAGAGVVVQPQDSRSALVSDSLVLSASEMLCNTNSTTTNHNNNSSTSNNNNNGSNSNSNNQQDSADIKWPNGLSYLSALTARADDKHLFFGPEYPDSSTASAVATLGQQQQQSEQQHQQLSMHGIPVPPSKHSSPASSSEFMSMDHHHHHHNLLHHHHQPGGSSNNGSSIPTRRMHAVSRLDKFKRSLTLPARMSPATPSPATSPHLSTHSQSHELVDPNQHHHHHQSNHESPMDFSMTPSATQGPPNMYSDLMEGFLE